MVGEQATQSVPEPSVAIELGLLGLGWIVRRER
ncbi:MAG: PEP-CTERM sorting domain-containing protein [Leptolyngbyaceae cyanobacterium SL_5_14]|nr:PEP-CTERM sorting domain-containing protein [Leptolyngbyaceae cyanobacterium SL_5_14]